MFRLGRLLPVTIRGALVIVFLLAVNLTPTSSFVAQWVNRGEQAARENRYQDVLVAYNHVLSYPVPQPVIYERLVAWSMAAGSYNDAWAYLYALADLDGWTPARREQLAIILETQGNESLAWTLQHASPDPIDDPLVLHNLAQQQIAELEWPQAEATLARLLTLEPGNFEAAYQLGLLLAPQAPDLASHYLDRAGLDPAWTAKAQTVRAALAFYKTYSLTDAHTYLGITLVGLNEWAFAEQALDMAVKANAVNPTALAYLGYVRDLQDRDGLPDIQAALAMSPNDPLLYYLLGQHWRLVHDSSAAYQAFSRAYWLSPDNPALAAEVGTELQNMSDFASAVEWLRRAVDLGPDDLQWSRVLAAFYADTGFQLETEGGEFIEQAAHSFPDDVDIQTSLGWAYYQTGDVERAYQELNAVISKNPAHVRARYYFGAVLEYRGDRAGAADSYWFVVETLGPDQGFGVLAARALQRVGAG